LTNVFIAIAGSFLIPDSLLIRLLGSAGIIGRSREIDHARWAADIEETQGQAPNYPIIGDSEFKVSKLYGMLPAATSGDAADRMPADNQTVRNVFVIGSRVSGVGARRRHERV
jgi:hypothetical protein